MDSGGAEEGLIGWLKTLLEGAPQAHDAAAARIEAITGLLVQAATMDAHFDAREHAAIEGILMRFFALERTAAQRAVQAAEARVDQAADLYQFTKAVNAAFRPEERLSIVEALWEVILVDGEVDAFEASLMRRLGTLIHVEDRDLGEARRRVAARQAEGDRLRPWQPQNRS
jgi:uncharacterized tellurite resistance protein B-like protein